MRKLFSVIVFSLLTTLAMAIPAKKTTFVATQSDGTKLTLKLMGDEYMHYYLNVKTNEKMLRGDNGDYYVISEIVYKEKKSKGDARRNEANKARIERLNARRNAAATSTNGQRRVGSTSGAMTGSKKGLVILVNFSDKAMASGHTQAAFNDQFNKVGYNQGGHLGSVHDYFYDQSYGKFDLTFDVVGPVTVNNRMSYYGGNDRFGSDSHPGEMVIEACKLADAKGINFKDYDWDGDGEVDQVFVIYAGYGEASSGIENTIWPHEWTLSSAAYYKDGTGPLTIDGVTVNTYACSCELSGDSGSVLNGMGTACHEFSHCLGLPDFYDTDYSGGRGMDSWDIMDSGSYNGPNYNGEVPAGYSAYERYELGWLHDADLLVEPSTISSMPPINDNRIAYMFCNGEDMDDYCFVENRKSDKWFRYYNNKIAGEGLFVTRIKYDKDAWSGNTVNDDPTNQHMTWIAPDEDYSSATGAFFPSTKTNSLNIIDHALTDITKNSNGTVSFLFDGGEVVDDGNRYTVTFNAGSGTCGTTSWTQSDFMESFQLPQAYLPAELDGWTFIGWTDEVIDEAKQAKPKNIYSAKSYYAPTADVTLYAVYKKGQDTSANKSYTLDYDEETDLQNAITNKYGNPVNYTAKDGGEWVVKAYKTGGMQINKGKDSSIKVPVCPSPITSIIVTDNTAKILSFSSTDYTGKNNPTAVASSQPSTSATISLEGKNFNTGYIYTTDGATVIKKIVVNYEGVGTSAQYSTYPSGSSAITTPTIAFEEKTKTILLGDSEIFTATVTGSTGEVTYSSSNEEVATVGPKTGRVATHSTGTTKITATVAAVEGVSKSASASYTLTVEMPKLQSIAVTTPPTTTTYWEGETFNKDGMVVTATYENGYKETADIYTVEPTDALSKDDTSVTITYKEGDVTVTTIYPITVNVRPLYTITFDAGSGTCETATLSESAFGKGITLPSATGINEEWVFAGWATENVSSTNTRPTLFYAGTTYQPTANQTLYAVYALCESTGGSGNYELVTEALDDWSGNYLIAYSDTIFANGAFSGQKDNGIGAANSHVNPGDNLSGNTVSAAWGDTYHITLESIAGGYVMKTQDGNYNYRTTNENGIDTNTDIEVAAGYPIKIVFTSEKDIDLICSGAQFHYNAGNQINDGWFRFYKNGAMKSVYLYKKQGTLLNVTYATSPTGSTLVTPTIAFANASDKEMLVGDTYENIATSDSEGTITYSSSDAKVVTVDKATGKVTAIGVGNATITAFVDAVAGVSKSASTTYGISVTMPELSSIVIKSKPTKTTYNEGEELSNEGLVITATYANGYVRDITQGYTTSPAEGEPVALDTKEVTINYTEGDITKTATYSITVNELPKYAVTFMINGKSTVISQTIANTAIETPTVADVITTIDGEEVTYTFAGWVNADVTEETTTKPKYITLTDGKYTPTEATTLYAVYVRTNGNVAKGFTLSLEYKGKTYYVGTANKTNTRFDSSTEKGVTLFFDNGRLWTLDANGKAYYANNASGKNDITFTNSATDLKTTWTMAVENGIATFYSSASYSYLALNMSSTDIIRAYGTSYPYQWNITYTGETFSLGSTSFYTSHPISAEEPTAPTIKTLAELINAMINNNATKADVDKMADELLGK